MIVPSDQIFATKLERIDLYQRIKPIDFQISMNVFGLRDLQSFGLLPVRKPFIKFNIKSLVPPEKAQAVTNLKTQTGQGADPNFNCILNFSVALPDKVVFSPVLKCEVFDHIFLGLNQPLIGHFGIKLGEIRQKKIEKVEETIALLLKNLKEIDRVIALPREKAQIEYVMKRRETMEPDMKIAIEQQKRKIEKSLAREKQNAMPSLLERMQKSIAQTVN